MHYAVQILTEAVQSPKLGAAVAGLTSGAGAVVTLDWIPAEIDKLQSAVGAFGMLCGAVLSLVLAWVHLQRWRIEKREYKRRQKHDAD